LDTKLRGWTAVRIICITLILALCFTALSRTLACFIRSDETGIFADVVLVDASSNQHFFTPHINSANYHASIVAYFGSEEAIEAGMHLKWFENINESYLFDDLHGEEIYDYTVSFALRTPDGRYHYDTLPEASFASSINRSRAETYAKRLQQQHFRSSLEALEAMSETEGLLYHIEIELPNFERYRSLFNQLILNDILIEYYDEGNVRIYADLSGDNQTGMHVARHIEHVERNDKDAMQTVIYSNVDAEGLNTADENIRFFKSHPVYYLVDGTGLFDQSYTFNNSYHSYHFDYSYNLSSLSSEAGSIFLAYSSLFVDAQYKIINEVRNLFIIDLGIIAACAVLVLAMTIILLVGAGKQNKLVDGVKMKSEGVHFSPLDKPYLDISLVFTAIWVILACYLALTLTVEIWSRKSIMAMNIIIAGFVLLTVPLVLYWLMSFVKRLKAGRFWKHTLIYAVIYSCIFGSIRFVIRKLVSLWAGTRLFIKVGLISVSAFFTMLFVGVIGAETRALVPLLLLILILTAIITLILALYARRLRNLEAGAAAASQGSYDIPINAGGGELGRIAWSINSISSGINTAVEERMKSERLKTELITNVSHDIRTPLTSIITYTDLLEHEGLDCDKAPEYLDVLKQKSLRLKTLTDELFEAAKASTGNIDVNLTELDIVSLVNQVMGELDNSIKSSGIDLRVNMPERLMAKADGRLMQRVMENLLSNVFKYSLANSRVYLDAYQADYSNVRIDIKNISATELNFDPSELTERFKRGDDSRADGGSGLGLSIVQSFVSAQGGKFEIAIDGDLFKATVLLPVPVSPQ